MRLWLGAAILSICGIPLLGSPTTARPPAGSADSYGYDYRCPADYVLIGIGGRQGSWMDAAWGICGRIRSDGTLDSGDRRVTRRAGGTGGTAKGRVCPNGRVLVGQSGTGRTYVNTIRHIRCARWDASRRVATTTSYPYELFPARSGTFSNSSCDYGMVAIGITGQAGIYLDRFALKCAYAPYANPPPAIRFPVMQIRQWLVGRCLKDVYGRCI